MWQELALVLKKIMSLYNELLLLGKEKKAIVVSAKINDLNELVKKEQLIINAVGKLEQQREKLVMALLAENKISHSKVEFSELIQYCDEQVGEELTRLQERTKLILDELSRYNKENSTLLEKALEFVNYNINLLSQAQVEPIYSGVSPQGELVQQNVVSRRLFDQKI